MRRYPTLASRAVQAIQQALLTRAAKRPRVRISFDIDDTLACQLHHADVESSWLPACAHRWWGEPLRIGTRSLTRQLRRQGCSIWVYTSSGRAPSYIRRWLMLYGIRVDGVVNSERHNHALTVHGLSNTPRNFRRPSTLICTWMIPRACALKATTTAFAWWWSTRRMSTGRNECLKPSRACRRNWPGSNYPGSSSLYAKVLRFILPELQ